MARQIVVDIIGDPAKFNRATKDATSSAGRFSAKTAAVMGAVSGVVMSVTDRIIDAVADFGSEIVGLGPKLEQMDAKARTVFGDSLGQVRSWANANANAMGLTSTAAIGLATDMGDLLVPIGFTRDQAAGMATDVIGLSGALSEWTGGSRSAAEVADILQKGMLGERDALKSLGISITEADLQQQLAIDGTDKLTGAALAQAKAQATLKLYLAKTTDAQKAYADGTAKGVRDQHKMTATIDEAKETLARGLYPILQKVEGFIAENLPGAIQFLKEAWHNLEPAITTIADILAHVASVVIPLVVKAVGTIYNVFRTVWPPISNIVGKIGGAFGSIIGTMKRVVNTLIRGWNSLRFTMPSVDLGPLGRVGGFTIGTPNIHYLHQGGVVPGTPGSDVPAILQAGETVLPADARGGPTIIINGPVYGDGIDELTRKIAYRLQYGG